MSLKGLLSNISDTVSRQAEGVSRHHTGAPSPLIALRSEDKGDQWKISEDFDMSFLSIAY